MKHRNVNLLVSEEMFILTYEYKKNVRTPQDVSQMCCLRIPSEA